MRYFYALLLTFFSFQFFSQIPNYVPTNGLVGWWPFTGNANDLSVNGNNGTVNGATLTTDRFGSPNCAYIFNGNSNIVVPYNQNQTIIGAGTWSLWVNASLFPNNGNQSHLISKYNSITNLREFVMEFDASTIKHNINDGTNWHTVSNGTSTQINQWVNVIAVYDKLITPSLKLYVNGALINTSNTFNGNLINNNLPIVFSNLTGVGVVPFQGKLDDIGIWNRALSQQEITALYTSTAGTVASLNCNSFTQNGNLYSGQAANNVSLSVPYTGGNAGFYAGQNVSSTGVTGLTATLTSGTLANGSGTLSYTITGTPSGVGNATFAINIGGQSCNLVVPITALSGQYPANSVFCANGPTAIVDVTNPTTGKTWMDRNLGASQVATSSTDQNAYGDLYQWGRFTDGHQCRTSATTATLSSVDQPAHGDFIMAPNAPCNWRTTQNNTLWQGVNGINNPCPSGYRLPTNIELDQERLTWTTNNSAGAFNSILKAGNTGHRFYSNGVLTNVNISAVYWTSTTSGLSCQGLSFDGSTASLIAHNRAYGLSVRCIKETVGSVGAINCNGATQTGNLIINQAANSVSASVPYTAGNGGIYNAQTLSSAGVTGLTATLAAGALANGNGTISYAISGTPSTAGTASFNITIGGQSCTLNLVVYGVQPSYPVGTVNCNGNVTIVNDVTNPTTGKTWMDRNLGASQVATSSTDQNAYGDLYQWGRRADGHQCRTSATTATLSSVDQPAHGNFILAPNAPFDWRSPQNINLWQGVNGVNNPCPSGYRLPMETEWNNELLSWSSNNSAGAFASPLKWPMAGGRQFSNGLFFDVGTGGGYWNSTVNGAYSRTPSIISNAAAMVDRNRAYGFSIRCIKETVGSVGALNCNGFTQSGNLYNGQAASNVSISVPYAGGNGGYYAGQTISSTGVTGLTATLTSGMLANGSGSLSYTITGTPSGVGNATFALSVGGQSCNLVVPITALSGQYPANSVFCANGPTAIVDVTNPTTGKTWMDRNLGASQVATSSTDQNAYGDLFQWGRRADGHQCRTSATTATLSSVDQPAHGNFIIAPNAPYDWRAPQNANLWQGINGVNNPCPSGYRIPTEQELNNERLSWSSPNTQGAFSSNLKLTLAGYRYYNSGGILLTAQEGFIWSSNINSTGTASRYLDWGNNNSDIFDAYRVFGMSVRCIKETVGSVGALNCNGTTLSGGVYANQAILGTTANVPYTSGNGGYIAAQTLNSTGVTGITATLSQGLLANGAGTLAFALSGTPSGTGTATFALTIGGQSCSFTVSVQSFASITINTNDTLCAGQSTTLTANAQNAGTPCAAPGLSGTLTNGLVGYWPFCGNANDLSGNANHGTVNGATLSTDRFGTANSAYSFNGNSRIRIPFTNSFSSTTGTVSAWINLTALPPLNDNQHLIFGKGWGYPQLLVRDDGKIYLSIANATNSFTVISSNSILVTSNWYFITAQYSSSNLRLYINGILDNSINVASGFYSFCNSEYFIGGFNHVNSCIPNDNVQNINGKLDDIGIWNRALTQQEITQLYQQGQATYLWSNGATTPSITVSPTQTTTYTCTVTMNGVSTTQSQTITVNALPTVTATANQTVCAGTSVTLNGSGASSYSWNNGISNGVAFTPNSTTTYTVTGTDANGCTNTAQTTVTVNALPAANITAQGATTFCQNNSVTLNANSGAGLSYQWYNNGSAINGANSATLPVSNAGSYTVQVTNANNCSQTSAATSVTVNALPAATITPASATTFCQGGSVVLNGNVGQGLSYQWNLNGSPINGANAASYTANASGNYSLDVLNSDGCSATSTVVSVTVNALPTVSAGANQTLCAGTAITLSGSGASSYTWNNGVSNGVAFTPVSTQTYTVTGTNANGCTNTAQVTVTVNALPTPTISYVGSPILCQGSTLALNSSAGSSYLWSNGQTTQSIQVTQGGAYTVQVTNANGCIGTSNPVNITVNPLPAPSITAQGPTTFCQGGSVVLTSTGATSYAWSTNATTQSITVTTSGLYQVTVVDNKGCSGSSSPIQVTVLSPPNASITTIGSTALCAGQSTSLSAPAGNTYLWSNGASTQNITVNTAGTYSVQVTNAAGCSANSNVVTISVNPVPVANISANGATSFCTGGSVVLTASAGASYLWNTGATTQSITVNSSGTFNVTVTGAGGCNATSAATSVTVNALPTASITASGNTTFCAGNSVLLSASNGSSYLWSNGATTPSISATAAGSYSVSVTNGAGCTATSTPVQITVNPLPTVSAGANQSICAGGQVTLNGSGATSYAWNNGVTNGVAFTPSNTQTYTVTGTNANGCSNTAQVTVTVNALPTVSAGTNQSICAGSQVTLMGSGANTYAWNNGVTNGVAFTPANTQTYTVTGTNTNGCSNTAQVTVTVNALPTASISASGSTTLCAGSSVNLSASNGSSYLWSNGATTQTITASTAGNYSVQVTNAAGCSATSSIVNVVVNPLPAANITANGSTTFCAGGSVVLSATAGASYLWNTGATTQTLTVNTSGTYTVTVTSNNGCVGTSSPQTVTVSAQPSTSITANGATSFCAGGSVLLSAPNGGTYLWSTGATTPSISVSTAGSYSVTVTNGAGCSATSTPTTITVNPLPSVSAGANQSVCSGSQVTLNGSGATSYAWNNGVTNGVAFTPGTTQTYTVTGTDANGCSNNAQVTITVNALPAVSAGANQSICAGNQITLNGSGASSYTWNNGVTNGVAFTPANTQTYTVTGTNANGCSNTAQVTVTVNALPTANAGSNALINCVNNPNGATLGAAPQAGFTYQWSPATGLSSATLANPVANPINSTTYTLTVTQTSTGCSNTASVNVTVNTSAPQANAGQNSSITCVANTNGVNIGSNPSAGLTYAWTPSTGLSASNISNPVANPLLTTTYTLTITNTSNGCTGTGTVTVSVNNTAPTVNAGQDQTVCTGQSVTLNATGANTYVWNNGAIQGVAFTPSSTQTYTVQGTNTVNGCTATDQVTVTLNALPTVSAGTNQTVCAGTAVTLTGTGASSYAWNNGVSNGVAFSPANTQTYTVTGTDANGCSNTAQVTVTVNVLPVVSAGANQSICAGTAVTLSGSGATNYTWNNGVSNGVAFTPTNTQTYTVTGTNANGCQGTAQVTVTVNTVPTPTLVANGTAPYCPGTNVVLSTPSLPGHTYQWYFGQNIINGATASTYTATTAGTYYVKVTAPGGCFGNSNSITVSYLNPTIIALGPTNICQGGNVVLQTAIGAGFQYTWMKNGMSMINGGNSASFTASSPGTYTVKIVTPSGCVMYSNPIQVSFIINPTASITANGSLNLCAGNSITLSAANNANAVSYQWRKNGINIPGATSQTLVVSQSGTYSVVIANQACPATSAVISNTLTIQVFPNPNPIISSSGTVVSPGVSVTLSTANGIGNTYQWYKMLGTTLLAIQGATQATYTTTSSGTFRVKVTNMYGCWKYSNSITIGSSQLPEQGVTCTSDGIIVKHPEGISNEGTWMEEAVDGTKSRITTTWDEANKQWVIMAKPQGNYVYETTEEETVMQWIRIVNVCNERTLVAYPNPTRDVMYLKGLEAEDKYYEISDLMGRVIAVGNVSIGHNEIDMSALTPGTYRLMLQGYGIIVIVKA